MRRVNPFLLSALGSALLGILAIVPIAGFPSAASAIEMQGSVIEVELELPRGPVEAPDFQLSTDEETIKDHFNLAACYCQEIQFQAKFTLLNPAPSYDSVPVEIWVGNACDDENPDLANRNISCELISPGFSEVEDLASAIGRRPIPTYKLMAPNLLAGEVCPGEETDRSVYAIIDEGAEGVDGNDNAFSYDIPIDTRPPPEVDNIKVNGGENAVQISWDLPSSRTEDVRFIQVLCARADESIIEGEFPKKDVSAQYQTSFLACNRDLDGIHPVFTPVGTSAALGPQADAGTGPDASTPDAGSAPDAGVDAPDAGVIDETLPESLYNLSPENLCGEVGGTESSVRVDGLENGIPYRIILLVIDESRNVTALDLGAHTPQPVEDAWEHYQNSGGNADGGYCFVATATYGNYDHPFVRILRNFRDDTLAHHAWGRSFIRWYYANSPGLAAFIAKHPVLRAVSYVLLAPLVAFAAVWEYTTALGKLALLLAFGMMFVMRKRRKAYRLANPIPTRETPPRRRRLALAFTSLFLLIGFSATAHAQPYWDELNDDVQMGEVVPKWNFEVKLGPYYPGVDDELSSASPFEEIFGDDWQLMTIFSLDRFFSFPKGQLGITGSIGYSRRSANAFQLDSMGNTIEDPDKAGSLLRSEGDKTGFSLIPTTVGVVYRFTMLDDDYGIPLVPYGKLGLSYYLWNFSAPDGDTSESPTDACPNPGELMDGKKCEGNLARGGSFGYQATVGIAVRAERIDPTAAISLRNEMGVQHAGFFIEGQLAVVDGFGADKKLSVGDTTWFGGINFEF